MPHTVIEQYPIGERLEVDFVVKSLSLALEADGKQHQTFNGFHYDGKDDFRAAKGRDQRKQVLCEQQGLTLIRLDEKEIMAAPNPEALLQLILTKLAETKKEQEEEW